MDPFKTAGRSSVAHKLLKVLTVTLLAFSAAPNSFAAGAACEIDISAPDLLSYDKTELTVDRACGIVKLKFAHTGKLAKNIMGHNWVLSRPADLTQVASDGQKAGLSSHYVKPNDSRVIAFTEIIGGGETTSIEFSVKELPAGKYSYFCTFPGHWTIMRGTLNVT